MNNISFIKEAAGGTTIVENGNEFYFGAGAIPHMTLNGSRLTLSIGSFAIKLSTTDTINIDPGTGNTLFSGTGSQLKAALIPVFPKAGTTATTTGGATTTDLDFTTVNTGVILRAPDGTKMRLTLVKDTDNIYRLNLSDPL